MNYIGVESPEIAKERVDLRVKKVAMEFHIKILKEDIMNH